jgi:hypothetical protein
MLFRFAADVREAPSMTLPKNPPQMSVGPVHISFV